MSSKLEALQEKTLREAISAWSSAEKYRADLDTMIAFSDTPAQQKVREVEGQIQRLKEQLAELQIQAEKENKSLYSEYKVAEESVRLLASRVKQICHNLPECEGFTISQKDGFGVRVTGGEYVVQYDSALVKDYPSLRTMVYEGDPLITETIQPRLLERLLSSGKIEIPNVGRYRQVVKRRNPSVTYLFGDLKNDPASE